MLEIKTEGIGAHVLLIGVDHYFKSQILSLPPPVEASRFSPIGEKTAMSISVPHSVPSRLSHRAQRCRSRHAYERPGCSAPFFADQLQFGDSRNLPFVHPNDLTCCQSVVAWRITSANRAVRENLAKRVFAARLVFLRASQAQYQLIQILDPTPITLEQDGNAVMIAAVELWKGLHLRLMCELVSHTNAYFHKLIATAPSCSLLSAGRRGASHRGYSGYSPARQEAV